MHYDTAVQKESGSSTREATISSHPSFDVFIIIPASTRDKGSRWWLLPFQTDRRIASIDWLTGSTSTLALCLKSRYDTGTLKPAAPNGQMIYAAKARATRRKTPTPRTEAQSHLTLPPPGCHLCTAYATRPPSRCIMPLDF